MGNQESIPNNNYIKKKVKKKSKTNNQYNISQETQDSNISNSYKDHVKNNKKNQINIINDNKRNNIVPIKNNKDYEDFSNYNYEIKSKNNNLNDALIERNYISFNEYYKDNELINYPKSSNDFLERPKPSFDDIKFTPYNVNDEVKKYKDDINHEEIKFNNEQEIRKKKFNEYKKIRNDNLEEKLKIFEEKYNPWEILGLENNELNLKLIKKAYKKRALKYHPDRNPDKEDIFNLINQAYIFLLDKVEEENYIESKINNDVRFQEYDNKINEGIENINLDKENFSLDKFNEIFEKSRVNESEDKGYSDLMKNNKEDEGMIFNSKVSNEIFNSHFSKLKEKKSNALIQYDEPEALNSNCNLNTQSFGEEYDNGFGGVNSQGLSYTDIKQAHYDDNLLIDPTKVKFKERKNIEELENERSRIDYKPNEEEKTVYFNIEKRKKEKEKNRLSIQKAKDEIIQNNFQKNNRKMIRNK